MKIYFQECYFLADINSSRAVRGSRNEWNVDALSDTNRLQQDLLEINSKLSVSEFLSVNEKLINVIEVINSVSDNIRLKGKIVRFNWDKVKC